MSARATTTILFSDLVNSTELLQRAGDEEAQRIFQAHHRLLRDVVQRHSGHEVKWLGDGLMVAFGSAIDAIRCAVDMQQSSRRPAAGERLQIRVGLNLGEALRDESDYFGTAVVVARRLCDSGDGGDIRLNDLVVQLVLDREEFAFDDLGAIALKGIARSVHAWRVLYEHDPLAMLAVTPFVGRADEIAALSQKLDDARGGRGSLVMLVGEPGIGKTRAIAEFSAQARSQGALVLGGRCYDGEWSPPFSPFVEAMRDYVSDASLEELRAMPALDLAVVSRIVPAFRERLPELDEPFALQAEGERYRLLDAVSSVLGKVADTRPLLLVLDDLHWADKGTIALLRHVARSAATKPVLILGAYRDVELDRKHPLSAALADLRRDTTFERIALKGLAAREVGKLLDVIAEQDVPRPLVEAIASETNGNPFFIREVLLHLVEERKIFQEDGTWTSKLSIAEMGIPEGVREVIGRRLSRLSDASNRMLTAASAMTSGLTWAELQAICEEPERALLDALDEALQAQVLVEPASGTYDFTHALIRHTLYDELSTPRRLLLHRRIGEALEALYAGDIGSHVAELAHHFSEGGAASDLQKAIEYSERAAESARKKFAYDDACAHYRKILSLLDLTADRDVLRRCDVLLSLGEELWRAGEWKQGQDAMREAAGIARTRGSGDRLARAAIGFYGRWYFSFEPDHEQLDILQEALDAVPEGDVHLRATLLARLTSSLTFVSDAQNRRSAFAMETVRLARESGDLGLLAYALCNRHWAFEEAEAPEARLAIAREATLAATDANDLETVSMAHLLALEDLLEAADIRGLKDELGAARRVEEQLHQPMGSQFLRRFDVILATLEGRFDDAEAVAAEYLQRNMMIAPDTVTGASLLTYGAMLVAIRRERGGLEPLESGLHSAADENEQQPVWRAALAALYAELDRPEEARAQLDRCLARGPDAIPRDMFWVATLALLSEACQYLGDRTASASVLEVVQGVSPRNVLVGRGAPFASLGPIDRFLGLLESTLRRYPAAEVHFEDALAMNTRMGARPWVARTQLDYARMLIARGDSGDLARARDLLDAALATARAIGMAKVAADCGALLAQTSKMSSQ